MTVPLAHVQSPQWKVWSSHHTLEVTKCKCRQSGQVVSLGHERCRIRTHSRCALPDPEDTLLCTLERVTVAKRTGYLGINEVFLLSLSTKLQIDFNILRAIFSYLPPTHMISKSLLLGLSSRPWSSVGPLTCRSWETLAMHSIEIFRA